MNTDLETQLRATLDEQAGATERLDVGSLAEQVMIRGRRLRRRRAAGAAVAAAVAVGTVVAVPTWVSGLDHPTSSHVATQPPVQASASPSVAPSSTQPSASATGVPEPSEAEVRAWLASLPDAFDPVAVTGDPWMLEIEHGEAFTGAEDYEAVARLRDTGQVLAVGDPHGAALEGASRLAIATETLGPDGRPSHTVTLTVVDPHSGEILAQVAHLPRGTDVRGWLDGKVVLDVHGNDPGTDRVMLWYPDEPRAPLIEVAQGRVLDVAESGHRILIEEPGGHCVRVWRVSDELTEPQIEDCGARLAAISDDGLQAYVSAKFGSAPTVLNLRTGEQVELQVPWPLPEITRWTPTDKILMRLLIGPEDDWPTLLCDPETGSCARSRWSS